MQPHQSFTDLAVIMFSLGIGKLFFLTAQITDTGLMDKIIGPSGTLVCLAISVWWLSARNKKMDKKNDESLRVREESIRTMTEALVKTSMVVEKCEQVVHQNNKVLEKVTDALQSHPCTK